MLCFLKKVRTFGAKGPYLFSSRCGPFGQKVRIYLSKAADLFSESQLIFGFNRYLEEKISLESHFFSQKRI